MSTSDPRWVSAWWLGYVIIGVLLTILSIPVFPLPRRVAISSCKVEPADAADSERSNVNHANELSDGIELQRSKRPRPFNSHKYVANGQSNNKLLQQYQDLPNYNSNGQTGTFTQEHKVPIDYMSDDECCRSFYDKLTCDQRRYLSCEDLYNSSHVQLNFSDVQSYLHGDKAKRNSEHDNKKVNFYRYHIPHRANDKRTKLGSCRTPTMEPNVNRGKNPKNSKKNYSLASDYPEMHYPNGENENLQGVQELQPGLHHKLKSWPESLKRLLKNPVIVLMVVEGAFFYVGLLGPIAFQLKYIEDQFDESASKISLYLGIGQMSTAVAGTYLGGYLTSRFSLTRVEMFKASLASQFTALLLSSCFVFLGCDNHDIIGLNVHLRNEDGENCLCANNSVLFLCGSDGKNYLSPCVAGCKDINDLDFRNCSQIHRKGTASPGFCDNGCHTFYPLLLVYILLIFTATLGLAPRTLMVCRSVAVEDESLANGLVNGFVLRCAAIGGPILFGQLYDNTCILWPHDNGSCKVSDKDDLRTHFQGTGIMLRAIGTMFMFAATVLVCLKDKDEKKEAETAEVEDEGG
ncbi:solute carrier organic anion transporter family member [Plakobranchus ocellatus]|uniref:Solute carrier organic anion transporter family member n=1 Tax=Plakobranchus ocellatus TaxID=259542 RepID=A0AAV4A9J2_9GAST|nr:solute carrier organic anion transporter family member [Plakobranchus ocellatus]